MFNPDPKWSVFVGFKKGVFLFSDLVKSSCRDFRRFCVFKKIWVCGLGLLYFLIFLYECNLRKIFNFRCLLFFELVQFCFDVFVIARYYQNIESVLGGNRRTIWPHYVNTSKPKMKRFLFVSYRINITHYTYKAGLVTWKPEFEAGDL